MPIIRNFSLWLGIVLVALVVVLLLYLWKGRGAPGEDQQLALQTTEVSPSPGSGVIPTMLPTLTPGTTASLPETGFPTGVVLFSLAGTFFAGLGLRKIAKRVR